MQTTLKRVPWTCRWGHFGGPLDATIPRDFGFVFWVCARPDTDLPRILNRDSCEDCARWEPSEPFLQESKS
jgi:hypothetical protein